MKNIYIKPQECLRRGDFGQSEDELLFATLEDVYMKHVLVRLYKTLECFDFSL